MKLITEQKATAEQQRPLSVYFYIMSYSSSLSASLALEYWSVKNLMKVHIITKASRTFCIRIFHPQHKQLWLYELFLVDSLTAYRFKHSLKRHLKTWLSSPKVKLVGRQEQIRINFISYRNELWQLIKIT